MDVLLFCFILLFGFGVFIVFGLFCVGFGGFGIIIYLGVVRFLFGGVMNVFFVLLIVLLECNFLCLGLLLLDIGVWSENLCLLCLFCVVFGCMSDLNFCSWKLVMLL